MSRMHLWDKMYEQPHSRQMYCDNTTAVMAGNFLRHPDISIVEDWGCGFGGFKNFIGQEQTYVGIDGSVSKYVDKLVDLENYISWVDAVHIRHVLEHNPNWRTILDHALKSFKKRMVLTLFTPFQDTTKVIKTYYNFLYTGTDMVDIGFKRDDIVNMLLEGAGINFTSKENIPTQTVYNVEHVFFLIRS